MIKAKINSILGTLLIISIPACTLALLALLFFYLLAVQLPHFTPLKDVDSYYISVSYITNSRFGAAVPRISSDTNLRLPALLMPTCDDTDYLTISFYGYVDNVSHRASLDIGGSGAANQIISANAIYNKTSDGWQVSGGGASALEQINTTITQPVDGEEAGKIYSQSKSEVVDGIECAVYSAHSTVTNMNKPYSGSTYWIGKDNIPRHSAHFFTAQMTIIQRNVFITHNNETITIAIPELK